MEYHIQKAQVEDLPVIEKIYSRARKFMVEHGNPGQWANGYPSANQLKRDIARENLYVMVRENCIHGVFYFAVEEDPTYGIIEGAWHSEGPYGVIHRIAGDGSGGILRAAVAYGLQHISHLRIDTHNDNYVMQRALEKQGFRRCGIIYLENGSPRIAYDRLDAVREAREEDLEEILELYLHLHETQLPEDDGKLRDTWNQIQNDKNYYIVVHEFGGRIVSSCTCVVIPNLTRCVRPYALVENVVTHRDYRGKGFATACLERARQIAQSSGCYKIMLLTGAKKEKTLDFYRNAGYNSSDKTAFVHWLDK